MPSAPQTCWECYDFEAALTHEVGHLLGLGHPDLAGNELVAGYDGGRLDGSVRSVHTGFFASNSDADRYPNSTTSLTLWDTVSAGNPVGVLVNPVTGLRSSIMESFTTHNPHSEITRSSMAATAMALS